MKAIKNLKKASKKKEVLELAEKLQQEWMKKHNDWRTPVWGYFRDEAERILTKNK